MERIVKLNNEVKEAYNYVMDVIHEKLKDTRSYEYTIVDIDGNEIYNDKNKLAAILDDFPLYAIKKLKGAEEKMELKDVDQEKLEILRQSKEYSMRFFYKKDWACRILPKNHILNREVCWEYCKIVGPTSIIYIPDEIKNNMTFIRRYIHICGLNPYMLQYLSREFIDAHKFEFLDLMPTWNDYLEARCLASCVSDIYGFVKIIINKYKSECLYDLNDDVAMKPEINKLIVEIVPELLYNETNFNPVKLKWFNDEDLILKYLTAFNFMELPLDLREDKDFVLRFFDKAARQRGELGDNVVYVQGEAMKVFKYLGKLQKDKDVLKALFLNLYDSSFNINQIIETSSLSIFDNPEILEVLLDKYPKFISYKEKDEAVKIVLKNPNKYFMAYYFAFGENTSQGRKCSFDIETLCKIIKTLDEKYFKLIKFPTLTRRYLKGLLRANFKVVSYLTISASLWDTARHCLEDYAYTNNVSVIPEVCKNQSLWPLLHSEDFVRKNIRLTPSDYQYLDFDMYNYSELFHEAAVSLYPENIKFVPKNSGVRVNMSVARYFNHNASIKPLMSEMSSLLIDNPEFSKKLEQ